MISDRELFELRSGRIIMDEDLSAREFNSEMERLPEGFNRKSTSSSFVIYWGVKLKEAL